MKQHFDEQTLRQVAAAFATGVTVISTQKEDGSLHGMTANSFLSVSLDPPIVAFSVQSEGTMMDYIDVGSQIGISILTENQIQISQLFAGDSNLDIEVNWHQHQTGVCTIQDCLAWYVTEVHQMILAGDHHIILCNIIDLSKSEQTNPLLYYAGYKRLG